MQCPKWSAALRWRVLCLLLFQSKTVWSGDSSGEMVYYSIDPNGDPSNIDCEYNETIDESSVWPCGTLSKPFHECISDNSHDCTFVISGTDNQRVHHVYPQCVYASPLGFDDSFRWSLTFISDPSESESQCIVGLNMTKTIRGDGTNESNTDDMTNQTLFNEIIFQDLHIYQPYLIAMDEVRLSLMSLLITDSMNRVRPMIQLSYSKLSVNFTQVSRMNSTSYPRSTLAGLFLEMRSSVAWIHSSRFSHLTTKYSGAVIAVENVYLTPAMLYQGSSGPRMWISNSTFTDISVGESAGVIGEFSQYDPSEMVMIKQVSWLIQGCQFRRIKATLSGGIMYFGTVNYTMIEIKDSEMSDILAPRYGAGLCLNDVSSDSMIIIDNVNATRLASHYGGFLYVSEMRGQLWIQDSQFSDLSYECDGCTSSNGEGGTLFFQAWEGDSSGLWIDHCLFKGRQSDDTSWQFAGGALFLGDLISNETQVYVRDSMFVDQRVSSKGGAIHISSVFTPHVWFINCVFENNEADIHGGAVRISKILRNGGVHFDSCLMRDNYATEDGGFLSISQLEHSEGDEIDPTAQDSDLNRGEAGGNIARSLYLNETESNSTRLIFSDCNLVDNQAGDSGGFVSIKAFGSGWLEMRDCNVTGNAAGTGGVMNVDSSGETRVLVLRDSRFIENIADGDLGGGVYYESDSFGHFYVLDSVFLRNQAQWDNGGVLSIPDLLAHHMLIRGCVFHSNTAWLSGGIFYFRSIFGTDVHIDECEFEKNEAGYFGGAGYVLSTEEQSRLMITECVFRKNTANIGGVLAMVQPQSSGDICSLDIRHSQFHENSAYKGGCVCFSDSFNTSHINMSHVLATDNSADTLGGFLLVSGQLVMAMNVTALRNFAEEGGVVFVNSGHLDVMDFRMSENTAHSSGAVIKSMYGDTMLMRGVMNNNTALLNGGTMATQGGIHVIDMVDMHENVAVYGGSLFSMGTAGATDSCVKVIDSRLHQNTVILRGGAVYMNEGCLEIIRTNITDNGAAFGAALRVAAQSTTKVKDCQITGNTAQSNGGVLFVTGQNPNLTFVTLERTVINDNYAHVAGVASCILSTISISNCTIQRNFAEDHSGAIEVRYDNNAFIGNDTLISDCQSGRYGGALSVARGGRLYLSDSVIERNTALTSDGGGIACSYMSRLFVGRGVRMRENHAPHSFGGHISALGAREVSIQGGIANGTTFEDGSAAMAGGILIRASYNITVSNISMDGCVSKAFGGGITIIVESMAAADVITEESASDEKYEHGSSDDSGSDQYSYASVKLGGLHFGNDNDCVITQVSTSDYGLNQDCGRNLAVIVTDETDLYTDSVKLSDYNSNLYEFVNFTSFPHRVCLEVVSKHTCPGCQIELEIKSDDIFGYPYTKQVQFCDLSGICYLFGLVIESVEYQNDHTETLLLETTEDFRSGVDSGKMYIRSNRARLGDNVTITLSCRSGPSSVCPLTNDGLIQSLTFQISDCPHGFHKRRLSESYFECKEISEKSVDDFDELSFIAHTQLGVMLFVISMGVFLLLYLGSLLTAVDLTSLFADYYSDSDSDSALHHSDDDNSHSQSTMLQKCCQPGGVIPLVQGADHSAAAYLFLSCYDLVSNINLAQALYRQFIWSMRNDYVSRDYETLWYATLLAGCIVVSYSGALRNICLLPAKLHSYAPRNPKCISYFGKRRISLASLCLISGNLYAVLRLANSRILGLSMMNMGLTRTETRRFLSVKSLIRSAALNWCPALLIEVLVMAKQRRKSEVISLLVWQAFITSVLALIADCSAFFWNRYRIAHHHSRAVPFKVYIDFDVANVDHHHLTADSVFEQMLKDSGLSPGLSSEMDDEGQESDIPSQLQMAAAMGHLKSPTIQDMLGSSMDRSLSMDLISPPTSSLGFGGLSGRHSTMVSPMRMSDLDLLERNHIAGRMLRRVRRCVRNHRHQFSDVIRAVADGFGFERSSVEIGFVEWRRPRVTIYGNLLMDEQQCREFEAKRPIPKAEMFEVIAFDALGLRMDPKVNVSQISIRGKCKVNYSSEGVSQYRSPNEKGGDSDAVELPLLAVRIPQDQD